MSIVIQAPQATGTTTAATPAGTVGTAAGNSAVAARSGDWCVRCQEITMLPGKFPINECEWGIGHTVLTYRGDTDSGW